MCIRDRLYADPRAPGSFSGVRNLQRYSGRSVPYVMKFLSGQDAYMLHKPRRIWFHRRKTYSKGIADLYQIDLVDVSSLSPFNDGMRYLLTCIHVFSKHAIQQNFENKDVSLFYARKYATIRRCFGRPAALVQQHIIDRNGAGRSRPQQRAESKNASLSIEAEIVQVEVPCWRQGAHRHVTSAVSQRLPR